MKTNCLIVDDEPIARSILENYIKEIPSLELVGSCKNAFEAIEFLQNNKVDLLFLDINMPKLSGLNMLRSFKVKPKVIVTTAYPEYAIEGFELSVMDYLLKPFSFARFLQATMKLNVGAEVLVKEVVKSEEAEYLFVKSDKKMIKIAFDEIYYIEAYGNYIKIYTDEMILVPQTLSEFNDRLPDYFMRTHKSYILNFNQLKQVEGNEMTLRNSAKLPIGKTYRKAVVAKINKQG